ncbi:Toxin coregulated pilus biosynthesis protein T [Photorhabdus australis subsp. thailandensis]|uniref:Toxin coregulated pilus biosynthesis protein T n=1 Tax=Photorhabdus australis subsp. thailandensis TaxID=2805096 RepID=A0A1C0U3Q3_9GAMM|nr:ATPase, T2SS/T4P/T4SS family [Photorhabdus australis]OCQ52560.1 Toxin coregulated pilus biosynthesis protein T [Photorhabdus australis subsp. thailandensis]
MTNFVIESPPQEIARYICVTPKGDDILDICYAENRSGDFLIQNYVSRVQKANPGRTRCRAVSLDEVVQLNDAQQSNGTQLSPTQSKVLHYFREAIKFGSSDLHFTIGRDNSDFCYIEARVHGELLVLDCIDKEEGWELASTIVLSMCDVTEKQFYPNQHQDGRIAEAFVKPLGIFGARYAHMPAVGGLYAVMRLIKDDGAQVPSFELLGFLPQQISTIKRLLCRPEGIIILSGPTGSGKSTTLRTASAAYLSMNGYTNRLPVKRLLTIEDPPEGRIPGAIQTPIIADKKNVQEVSRAWLLSIAYALRSDPDAILNGEIRDYDSAMAAIKAAMTGHLMMTTLHANNPINIIERLETEGVPGRLIADPQLLMGLISQRLVQRICLHCKRSYASVASQLTPDERMLIERYCQPEKVFMRHDDGCEHCYKGVIGRVVVAEVIAPDAQFYKLYRTDGPTAAKTYWHRSLGGITRNQHVLHYINAGEVDPLAADTICPLDEDSYTLLKED